ncbi:MAG: efflux RND transporter permease subunit, partial [Myxococcota bacterium]
MTRFLENPRIVAIAALLVVVAGMAAMGTIVRQEDPTITNGIALIITPYPGASAERVESLVTERIEEELQTIREIEELRSTSRAGISIVTVLLDETLIGEAATAPIFSKVRDAIGDVQDRLPTGAGPSIIDDERFGAYTVIYGLRWEGGDALPAGTTRPPLAVMRRTAERLEELLRGVKGSDHARVFGGGAERIHVLVDTAALAAAGLRPQDVARALAGADAKVAAGVLRGPGERMVVEVSGELDGAARVRAVPLGTSPDGRVLRVADIAQVERGLEDPPRERARVDGAPGILVGAQLAAGQRFDLWRERVEARVAPLRAELPDGVSLDLVFDQTLYTQERLSGLLTNLVTGLALVVTVLFVTLGVRAAFLVTLALPLVTLASLAVLRFLGVPIHQMSVTGLIVALGLLVDNAIVVVDAVGARRREGMSGPEAVKVSLHHLAVPLFASTLTTVLAFMPILLLPGRVGEFVGTIGLSVIVALLASYIAAMTLVAAMAGRFLSSSEGRFSAGFSWPRGGRWFAESIRQSLARPRLSIVVAGILPLLGFVGALTVPQQFFPPADRDQLHLELRMAPASSFAETERAVDRVEAILRARPEVKEVSWTIGRSAPPIYYNMRQSQDGNPAYAQALIRVGSVDDVSAIFDEVQRQVNAEVPDAQIILRELLQGPPVDAPVEYRIHGPDPEILRTLGEELRLRMSRVPSIIHSTASLTKSTPKLRVE